MDKRPPRKPTKILKISHRHLRRDGTIPQDAGLKAFARTVDGGRSWLERKKQKRGGKVR